MDETENITETVGQLIAQVYAIHEAVIGESGGMEGLRDGAMLHAAVARPFATLHLLILTFMGTISRRPRRSFIR